MYRPSNDPKVTFVQRVTHKSGYLLVGGALTISALSEHAMDPAHVVAYPGGKEFDAHLHRAGTATAMIVADHPAQRDPDRDNAIELDSGGTFTFIRSMDDLRDDD